MGKEKWITVLESDWSEQGLEKKVGQKDSVGPPYTYRDLLIPSCKLFDVEIDHTFFNCEQGLEVLLKRFHSHPKRDFLCIGGHGGPTKIHTAGGDIPIWKLLKNTIKSQKNSRKHYGLLFASCDLAKYGKESKHLINESYFKWIAAYREASSYLSGLQTEITFWKCLLSDWHYYKIKKPKEPRGRSVSLKTIYNPIKSALATYLFQPNSIGLRFDVRCLNANENDMISSLEIFAYLAEEIQNKIKGIDVKKTSAEEAKKYKGFFDLIWNDQWDWWPSD